MLLTGRHGSSEVGHIDPTVLTGEQDNRLLLLAGRSWHIKEVEWSKRIVWLEPAQEGGKAHWIGGARSIGRDVCQAIKSVLTLGAPSIVLLSQRAKTTLRELVEELPISLEASFMMTKSDVAPQKTWTFCGTRANRTWAYLASIGRQKIRFDAMSIQTPISKLNIPQKIVLRLTEADISEFAESIKFAECVPRSLLEKSIISRNYEIDLK
jgi:ATP-dependent Lhr-like helicase